MTGKRGPHQTNVPPIELKSGARLDQEQFHRLYEQMPTNYRAELIGGVVHEPSPVSYGHSKNHVLMTKILGAYEDETPGVELLDNATVILGDKDELQPDLLLRVRPQFGGLSEDRGDGYISGPPELVIEIAFTSRAIDLGSKHKRYAKGGVAEYLVVCLEPKQIRWFDLANNTEFAADGGDVIKSRIFPGLWLNPISILQDGDSKSAIKLLKQGLKSDEHKKFVARMKQVMS
jgi:Uma2 family endonuclease